MVFFYLEFINHAMNKIIENSFCFFLKMSFIGFYLFLSIIHTINVTFAGLT